MAWSNSAALAAIACLAAGLASAATPQEQARAVLAQAKAAAGGAALDRMRGWHESGEHNGARYETWLDPHSYGMTYREVRDGKVRIHGFDGVTDWRSAPDGKIQTTQAADAISDARQSAYFSISGFFFPDRFAGDAVFLGRQDFGGRVYDVLQITPAGAKPLEVWFDHATHLMTRGVDRSGPTPLTMTASDFRTVDGVVVPFHITQSDGDPAHEQSGQLSEVDFAPVDRRVFAPPAAQP